MVLHCSSDSGLLSGWKKNLRLQDIAHKMNYSRKKSRINKIAVFQNETCWILPKIFTVFASQNSTFEQVKKTWKQFMNGIDYWYM